MAYNVGVRLGVEGEADFKKALTDIDSSMKMLNSEVKLTTEQFKGQEDSIEGLTQKHDVLQKALSGQQGKIDTLRAAMKNASDTFGENDKKTNDWATKLNKAEIEAIKLQRSIDETTNALEEFGQEEKKSEGSAAGLGDALNTLGQKFGVSLPENMTQSLNSFMKLDARSIMLVGGFAALAAAITDVIKKLGALTIEQSQVADDILTTATVTGISTDALQKYAYAAELVDVSLETLTGSQTKLIKSMDGARQGSAAQAEAFKKLRIEYVEADGTLRDIDETYWEIIDALGRVTNETERDAIAMQLLGKSARDLNPLIEAGSKAMKTLGDEAKATGYILDENALEALGAVDDAMQRFERSVEAAKKQVAAEFAPAMEKTMKKATELVGNLAEAAIDSGLIDAFAMLLDSVTGLIAPADKLGDETIPKLTDALRPLSMLIASIANTIDFIKSWISFDYAGMAKSLGIGYTYGNGNQVQTLKEQWEQQDINAATKASGYGQYYANGKWYSNYDEYLRTVYKSSGYHGSFEAWKLDFDSNATGNDNYAGGWTWAGENGPELIRLPQGSQILNAQESRSMGDTIVYVTIDAKNVKEFNDVVTMAQTARMRVRKADA